MKYENIKYRDMKYLTVTVPCYNSEDYMERCIDSLLAGGEDVEIIIVNDGSTDRTGEIADDYVRRYPNIVRAVHKENGGHGSGVNKGMELATGLYFKVVDSDDWLAPEAYRALMYQIKEFCREAAWNDMALQPDLFVCNYVYDHLDEGTSRAVNYKNVFPAGCMCTWNEIGHFHPSQYLIMHALVFRTEILRKSGVRLPEHTFYVDNIFAYQPLPLVQNIFYMDIDLYHYYLGRDDQSVNEEVLKRRIDQQIYVTNEVSRCVNLAEVKERFPKLASYMCRNISIMMAISSIHLLLIQTEEANRKHRELWRNMRRRNKRLYYRLKFSTLSGLTCLPGKLGGKITVGGYRVAKRIYQFQ